MVTWQAGGGAQAAIGLGRLLANRGGSPKTRKTSAFSAGVRVVCLPFVRDQLDNARRVAELGLGCVLSSNATATAIRSAISKALDSSAIHENAKRMAAVIRGYGGGRRAVAMLENWAATAP